MRGTTILHRSLFDLLYEWKPCILLQCLQDEWAPSDPMPGKSPTEHLNQIQSQLAWIRKTATTNLLAAQAKQKLHYDQNTTLHSFQVGDSILAWALFFPRQVILKWEGPFIVTKVLGPITYEVQCGPWLNHAKALHVNHLKRWHDPDKTASTAAWSEVQPPPLSAGDLPWWVHTTSNTQPEKPPVDTNLTTRQQCHLDELLAQFGILFY